MQGSAHQNDGFGAVSCRSVAKTPYGSAVS